MIICLEPIQSFQINQLCYPKSLKTKASERALSGQHGSDIINDFRGMEVLSSYEKLNIKGLNWAIITEIDEDEIMEPKSNLINTILIICAIIAIIMMPVL